MAAVQLPLDVLAHSRFFDHLVDLIPAKFYHTEEEPAPNLKYMKKDVRESEKTKRKLKAKAAKRAKLDPETAQTALDVQRDGALRIEEEAGGSDEEEGGSPAKRDVPGAGKGAKAAAKAVPRKALLIPGKKDSKASMEELRSRLQSRLTVLREQRKVEERKKSAEEAAKWRDRTRREGKGNLTQQLSKKRKGRDGGKAEEPAAIGEVEQETQLTFGQLTFGQDLEAHKKKRQKKATKEELLAEAEHKQADRQTLATSVEGQTKLHKEAWGAALSRAKGEKILDDPKLLRKSLKKEQKVKHKKTSAWKERKQLEKKQGKEKQQKRTNNLQARATQKKENKIAKREKKLMRPGFEGRRDTPINGKR